MPLGKIARLPKTIRDELNRRLDNHEPAQPLLDWLNGLPEVRELLDDLFGGKPVSPQNLSQWRQGGFRHWQAQQEALKHVPDVLSKAEGWQAAAGGSVADTVSTWGAVHYLMTAKALVETGDHSSAKLKLLRHLCLDAVALQRGEHRSGRLKFDHERFAFAQELAEATGKTPKIPTALTPLKPSSIPMHPRVGQASRRPNERVSASGVPGETPQAPPPESKSIKVNQS